MTLMFDSACDYVGGSRDANLDRAKALGASVISCYIVGTPGGCPHTTAADVAAIHQRGMGAYANWERAADFFRGASIASCENAGAEARDAMKALGFPNGTAGAFSWDYDVLTGDYAGQRAKAAAVKKGIGPDYEFTAYSELGLLADFIDHGVIPAGVKGWLCMSEGFGGFSGDWGKYVAAVQQHNASKVWLNPTQPGTDINTIIDPYSLGAWWPSGSPYEGDNMPTPEEYAAAVWAVQLHAVNADGTAQTGNHPARDWLTNGSRAASLAAAAANDEPSLAAIAAAVVAALPSTSGGASITEADVENAVRTVLTKTTLNPNP